MKSKKIKKEIAQRFINKKKRKFYNITMNIELEDISKCNKLH
jgi:hypothetical protein